MKKLLVLILFCSILSCEKDELFSPDPLQDDVALTVTALKSAFPDILPLPTGFQPEGIVIGPKNSFYVGSLVSGVIYKGNLRTGEGAVFITPQGPAQAVGLALDKRSGYLFVAGGFFGTVSVYNYETGALVQTFQLATPGSTLINDVIVTHNAAYITDSGKMLYKIPLTQNGQLPEASQVVAIDLIGDFSIDPNPAIPFPLGVNANGIDATPSGKTLIIANTDRGEIYLVNPMTGETSLVDLGGALLFYADGILLDGKTLYVVQNVPNIITVIQLNEDLQSGNIANTITFEDADLGIPTTIAEFGNYLYAVNAHFDLAPPDEIHPNVEFEVVKVRKIK